MASKCNYTILYIPTYGITINWLVGRLNESVSDTWLKSSTYTNWKRFCQIYTQTGTEEHAICYARCN